jgi:hypothetical protein
MSVGLDCVMQAGLAPGALPWLLLCMYLLYIPLVHSEFQSNPGVSEKVLYMVRSGE